MRYVVIKIIALKRATLLHILGAIIWGATCFDGDFNLAEPMCVIYTIGYAMKPIIKELKIKYNV